VASRLQPAVQLGMMDQQAQSPARLNDKRRAGQVANDTGPVKTIVVLDTEVEQTMTKRLLCTPVEMGGGDLTTGFGDIAIGRRQRLVSR